MRYIDIIKEFITNPNARFYYMSRAGIYNKCSDKVYLEKSFRMHIGRELNLNNPKSFNEKLQWLKINDHNPYYIKLVDKFEAKKVIGDIIGTQYIIPTLGVWDSFDKIEFEKLPSSFVLKCTHDSGGVIIIKDKSRMNKLEVRKKLNRSLKRNYYYANREWPYKNVKPQIIAENYMTDDSKAELMDYKFMCFNGKHRCTFTCTERYSESGLKVTFFDKEWNVMPFERHYPVSKETIKRPKNYELMVELSEKISKNLPFARIDFYEIFGKAYFGEVTLYPGSGFEEFTPYKWDEILGSWLDLKGINIQS